MKRATQPEIVNLKITYNSELFDIKHTIAKEYRSLHDKIFVNVLDIKRMPQNATHIFEEFIKGISYFEDEISGTQPIYHRLYSCGPYQNTHRLGNLVCFDSLTNDEIERRKPLIERCYAERLIYNEIYKTESLHFPSSENVQPTQDKGHIFRLDLTRQDYETCFPGCKIEINIEYMNESYPLQLVLIKTHKNGRQTIHTWKKTLKDSSIIGGPHYDKFVSYSKQTGTKIRFKTFSFDLASKCFQL